MNRSLCVLLITAVAVSCKKNTNTPVLPASEAYKEYIIPKGSHAAKQNDYRAVRINKLKFSVLFDSSCIYAVTEEWNATDVNKLYGFSDCNTTHHESSARFGWRWTGREIEIYAYCYVNSIRHIISLGTVTVGKAVEMSIAPDKGYYVFEMNGHTERMQRNCSTEYADGYQLYPYFGGDETAPHDIRILIKELQ